MKNYEIYLDKLVSDGIEAKYSLSDIVLGIKELSGKLDTLIALKEVESERRSQQPQRQAADRWHNGKAGPEAQVQGPPSPPKLIAEVVAQQIQNPPRHE